jgi:Fe-coproporphyrin III synthase
MGDARDARRVLQVHPTRRCNLRCLHCYSLSGPHEREELPVEMLLSAIDDAAAEGYDAVSVSGGEPLLYKGLADVLAHAKGRGMLTAMTTNGMLLTERRVEPLAGLVDLVAVSIDGMATSHDSMRARSGAFRSMRKGLSVLRDHGIHFGLLFTLTQFNLGELPAVGDFAVDEGAWLLQVHPLHDSGAAVENLPGWVPDSKEMAFASLEALRILAESRAPIRIQVDSGRREHLLAHPEEVFAAGLPDRYRELPLARLVHPLCIEASGRVSPLLHGFHAELELGNLHNRPLSELATEWRLTRCPSFYEHCRAGWNTLGRDDAPALLSWYDELSHMPPKRASVGMSTAIFR